MTREEFIDRVDDIMCGTSNSERAYLEQLYYDVTAPHWRSVEDELPPKDVQVLVCSADFMDYCGMWWSHRYDKPKFYGEHEVLTDKNGFSTLRDDKGEPIQVTHWMRIEPPVKES